MRDRTIRRPRYRPGAILRAVIKSLKARKAEEKK